jgi:rubrerythrin
MKTNKQRGINGKKMLCDSCGYEWITTSELKLVTCPSCLTKVESKHK